jgi:hypothetical protein
MPAERGVGLSPIAWAIIGLVALGLLIWLVAGGRRRDQNVVVDTRTEGQAPPYDRDRRYDRDRDRAA